MPLQKIEDVPNPEVGRYYLVPHVLPFTGLPSRPVWLPVIGPWHEDADIGTPHYHYHYDARFIPERLYVQDRRPYLGKIHCAQPIGSKAPPATRVLRRKMLRQMPDFPGPAIAPFLRKLEKDFGDHQLKCRVCPHRGMSLQGLPQDEEGRVICNGHGLRWNLKTNRLSPR